MNTNSLLRGALVLLTLCFVGLIAFSLRDASAKVGGPAPEFSIKTDSGRQVSVDAFGGKVLVLNFWATWCAPCIQEIPSLNQFQKQFADSGVRVVAISIDKNQRKYQNFLQHVRVSFDTAWDPSADISARYGTFQYPETYIIKDGRVMKKYAEGKDWSSPDVTAYVKGLL